MNNTINIILNKVYKKDLDYTETIHGQIIYCPDTREVYYDNENNVRTNITPSTIYLETDSDRLNIYNPLINRLYIVSNDNVAYSYFDESWITINTESQMYDVISNLDDFTPTVLESEDKFIAPKALASSVFMSDGSRLSTALKGSNILTVTKTKAVYVEVEKDNQKIFTIPYPISNYDLARNYVSFIVRGNLYEPNRYVINNNRLILNTNNSTLVKGEVVLFIFYYTVMLDLNDNVVLTTKNYEDKSITTEKLSDTIRIEATKIIETVERIFMTPEERDKLRGVAYNATCYYHPETHPATMIDQDETHRFVSDIQIYNWNHKANADEVYTKEQTDERIQAVVDVAPEALNTLKEIADSLNNDPDFANTMISKLALKADKTELKALSKEVEKKTDMNDYIRNCIYNTALLTRSLEGDYYNISVQDLLLKEYIDGMQIVIKIKESNIKNSFLQINNLGYRKILTQEHYELIEGELLKDSIYTLRYNGTTGNFILQGKGGVKLNHSTQNKYAVDLQENVSRGNIIDIVDSKIRNSLPKTNLISTSYLNTSTYYCDKDIKVKYLKEDKIIVSWIDNNFLKLQVFDLNHNTKEIIHKELEAPLILNQECMVYELSVLNSNKIIVSYGTVIKTFVSVMVSIENTSMKVSTPKVIEDIKYTTKCQIINVRNDKAIIIWRVGDLTRCMYINTNSDEIDIISERTNMNYPIDKTLKINTNQILFSGITEGMIKGWIMNIDDLDFYNNTLITTYTSNVENELLDNLKLINLNNNNNVLLIFTNIEKSKCLKQILTIEENGGITYNSPEQIYGTYEEVTKKLLNTYKLIYDDLYISISKDNGLSVVSSQINSNTIKIFNKNIALFNMKYTSVDFDILNNNLIVVYSNKLEGENNHLFFSSYNVQRLPNGIAMKNGIESEVIPVSEWK